MSPPERSDAFHPSHISQLSPGHLGAGPRASCRPHGVDGQSRIRRSWKPEVVEACNQELVKLRFAPLVQLTLWSNATNHRPLSVLPWQRHGREETPHAVLLRGIDGIDSAEPSEEGQSAEASERLRGATSTKVDEGSIILLNIAEHAADNRAGTDDMNGRGKGGRL